MKTILTLIFSAFAMAMLASIVLPPYNKSKPPKLPLPAAYERALNALGSMTNEFHCISASVTTEFTPEGEWYFTFYSTNSIQKFVAVKFDGKVIFDNEFR